MTGPAGRRVVIPLDETPIFRDLAAEYAAGLGPAGGRHHWLDHPTDPTEEVPVARHHDHDGDGLADQADPDHPSAAGWAPQGTYAFPDPGWRPESDFTGEWIDELVAGDAAAGATP